MSEQKTILFLRDKGSATAGMVETYDVSHAESLIEEGVAEEYVAPVESFEQSKKEYSANKFKKGNVEDEQ